MKHHEEVRSVFLCSFHGIGDASLSYRLGHPSQGGAKDIRPWFRKDRKPIFLILLDDKRKAQRIVKQTLQKVGLPPLEFPCQVLENLKEVPCDSELVNEKSS